MDAPTIADVWLAKLSGVAGSLISLKFITCNTWLELLTMVAGGSFLSLYAAPYVTMKTDLPEGLAGFLLGVFGMAIAAKVWEAIQATPAGEILGRFLPVRKE